MEALTLFAQSLEFQMLSRPLRHLPFRAGTQLTGAALGLSLMMAPASAQSTPQQATTAAQASVPLASLPDHLFSGKRSREVFATQVMLDRARFSPGVIDGYGGGNTARAVKAYQRTNGMSPTGYVDPALLAALRGDGAEPVVKRYALIEADLAGPFGDLPEGMEALSKVEATHYESAAEAIAEKFHMSQELLRALNPDINRAAPGDTITVAATRAVPIEATVERIEVDGRAAALRAYAADGRLLAAYPATVGSADFPSPNGKMEVRAIAPAPAYYFSPEGRDWGPDRRLTIAPGPNNPVGSTWIDLTKEGYGIHGTPYPRLIGKTPSHGCVRLTNWDAQELAKAVEKGTTVEFL